MVIPKSSEFPKNFDPPPVDISRRLQPRRDFRQSMRPTWFDQYWDYPRNRTLKSMERFVASGSWPDLMILAGPTGSGKSVAASILGGVVSCRDADPNTLEPCGKCSRCSCVFNIREEWYEGLLMIDPTATRDGVNLAGRHLRQAVDRATRGSFQTNPPIGKRYVILCEEAHRLPAKVLESLLMYVEQEIWATFVLATTRLDLLEVKGTENGRNPLISRSEIYSFEYPTLEECVEGVIRNAAGVGINLHRDAADWIVRKHACCPRDILGVLYRLSNHGKLIDMSTIKEEYGPDVVVF